MSQLVFQSDDARRDHAEFVAKGLTTYEPFDFSRQTAAADGGQETVRFSLAFVSDTGLALAGGQDATCGLSPVTARPACPVGRRA